MWRALFVLSLPLCVVPANFYQGKSRISHDHLDSFFAVGVNDSRGDEKWTIGTLFEISPGSTAMLITSAKHLTYRSSSEISLDQIRVIGTRSDPQGRSVVKMFRPTFIVVYGDIVIQRDEDFAAVFFNALAMDYQNHAWPMTIRPLTAQDVISMRRCFFVHMASTPTNDSLTFTRKEVSIVTSSACTRQPWFNPLETVCAAFPVQAWRWKPENCWIRIARRTYRRLLPGVYRLSRGKVLYGVDSKGAYPVYPDCKAPYVNGTTAVGLPGTIVTVFHRLVLQIRARGARSVAVLIGSSSNDYFFVVPAHFFRTRSFAEVSDKWYEAYYNSDVGLKTVHLKYVAVHADFDPATGDNDIAVVKVKTRDRFLRRLQKACPPATAENYQDLYGIGQTNVVNAGTLKTITCGNSSKKFCFEEAVARSDDVIPAAPIRVMMKLRKYKNLEMLHATVVGLPSTYSRRRIARDWSSSPSGNVIEPIIYRQAYTNISAYVDWMQRAIRSMNASGKGKRQIYVVK